MTNIAIGLAGSQQPDGWREMSTAILEGRGLAGLAEALHHVTGRPSVIEATGDGPLAAAGDFVPEDQAGADADDTAEDVLDLRLFDPGPRPDAAARRGPWWVAPVVVDGAVVANVKLWDPRRGASAAELVALELAASTAALQLLLDRARTDRELEVWGDFATELLEDPTAERVKHHARRFGFDLNEAYRALVVEPTGRPPFRFAARCQTVLAGVVSRPFLGTERDGRVLLAVGDELPWVQLAERLTEVLGTRLRIGVGGQEPLRNLQRSVTDAEAALRMAPPTQEPTVAVFDDLGIWRILARASDVDLDEFIDRWLGALLRYDTARRTELVKTLATYFACNGELDTAAGRLFVHRNTLKYRMSRIADITAVDLSDARQRLHLELACEAWTVRKATAPPQA